jgi:hypothetical protein
LCPELGFTSDTIIVNIVDEIVADIAVLAAHNLGRGSNSAAQRRTVENYNNTK